MSGPKIFFARLRDMAKRFDPRYVAFCKRTAEFRYPVAKLSELLACPPEYGAGEAGKERTSIEQPRYIRITDIDDNGELSGGLGATADTVEAKYFLLDGDLLFARSGATVGKCYLHEKSRVKYPCLYAGYMIRMRLKPSVLPKYVFAFTQTSYYREWVASVQRTAGQPNINAQEYCSLQLPVPPLDVQEQIVAELDAAYAAKRAADEKATKLLASIDDMVLKELGIAKLPKPDTSLSSRIFTVPAREVLNGRLDPIAYQPLRRHFYKTVREGTYEAVRLGEVVDVDRRQTDSLDGLTYVGLENINGEDGSYCPTNDKESISTAVLFQKGEILFPKLRPYLNKVWLSDFDGAASTEFFPLIPTGVSAEYLIVYLRLAQVAKVMTLLMTGNTLPRVQLEDVLSLPVPIPPRSVQDRIASAASSIRADARKLKADATAALEAAKGKIEEELIRKEC